MDAHGRIWRHTDGSVCWDGLDDLTRVKWMRFWDEIDDWPLFGSWKAANHLGGVRFAPQNFTL
jgi:hypothetical protein